MFLQMTLICLISGTNAVPCTNNQHCSSCAADTRSCLTKCDTGYYGPECNIRCSPGCRNNKCELGSMGTERCKEGCKPGFQGVRCATTCRLPQPREMCEKCPQKCEDGLCQLGSTCVSRCTDSHYGTNCSKCDPTCEKCDILTGTCLVTEQTVEDIENKRSSTASTCPSNWRCSSCAAGRCLTECFTGYYGPGCSIPCSVGCRNNICEVGSSGIEICTEGCKPGYRGVRCATPCREPRPSELCQKCPHRCDDGFCQLGSSCVSGCKDSYYGTNCTMCDSWCEECHFLTGNCLVTKPTSSTDPELHPYSWINLASLCASCFLFLVLLIVCVANRTIKRRQPAARNEELEGQYAMVCPSYSSLTWNKGTQTADRKLQVLTDRQEMYTVPVQVDTGVTSWNYIQGGSEESA